MTVAVAELEYTVASVDVMWERAKSGEVDAATWKAWALRLYFDSEIDLKGQLVKIKNDDLRGMARGAYVREMKKAQLVKSAYEVIGSILGAMCGNPVHDSWVSHDDIISGKAEEKRLANVRSTIEKITQADMDAYAAKYAELRAAHTAALEDPQTLDDYAKFLRAKSVDALTDEQLARLDRLVWERDQKSIQAEQERRRTIRQIDAGDVEMSITEEMHTKKNVPIWIVKLDQRVERDTYQQLSDAASRLGGGWSRFSGGFLFWEKEDAETFMGVTDGDVSAADRAARRRRETEERAADRLEQYAIRKDGRAMDELSRDRLANTVRRARMAASAEASARDDQAMAATIASVATAQAEGTLTVLANVRSATQIAELVYVLRRAMVAGMQKRNEYHGEVAYSMADIRYTAYPWPYWPMSDAKGITATLKGKRGAGSALATVNGMIEAAGRDAYGIQAKSAAQASAMVELASMYGGRDAQYLKARHVSYQRLERMGIDNCNILRYALSELFPHVVTPALADPVTVAEREMIGMRIAGYFPTPADVVQTMMDYAKVEPGMKALEPSAGKGNIVDALLDAGAVVTAVECSQTLVNLLQLKYGDKVTIEPGDFLAFDNSEGFDRIPMNPPFEDGQDMAHVQHAYSLLRRDGRLVAIMSAGTKSRPDAKTTAFRAWLEEVGGTLVEELPAGTFYHEAGTNVPTIMVVIDK